MAALRSSSNSMVWCSLKSCERHLDHAHRAGDDLAARGDDGLRLLAAEHRLGDLRRVGEVAQAGLLDDDARLREPLGELHAQRLARPRPRCRAAWSRPRCRRTSRRCRRGRRSRGAAPPSRSAWPRSSRSRRRRTRPWRCPSTRHTTTAAMSTGLPRLSLTLRRSPFSVRARRLTLYRLSFLGPAWACDSSLFFLPQFHCDWLPPPWLGGAVGVERVAPAEPALLAGALVGAEEDEHARLVGLHGEEPGAQQDRDGEHDAAGDEQGPLGDRASGGAGRAVDEREVDEDGAEDVERDGDDQHGPAAHHARLSLLGRGLLVR